MKAYIKSVTALCLTAGGVHAGALDRTGQSVDVLFEDGRYVEFSLSGASPDLSGVSVASLGGNASSDIAPTFGQFSAAYKADINDKFSYAVIFDRPFGADVDYAAGTGYFAAGSNAEFESNAVTALLQYNMDSGVSVYGGLRLQTIQANADILFPAFGLNYTADTDREYGLGYVGGVAYERPDIALRVSLTYSSEISYDVSTSETIVPAPNPINSITEVETPQSLNLAFQTGVAADTLVFGGVRWVDWSDFDLTPITFLGATSGSILSYESDVITYTLGVGRKLSDTWSVAATLGYERNTGDFFTNLGPSDGQESLGLAAIYTKGNMKVTTGIRYVRIGDAVTRAGPFAPGATFEGNDAIGLGVKVGFNF